MKFKKLIVPAIFLIVIITIIYSLSGKKKPAKNSKTPYNDTADWVATYVIDGLTWTGKTGPVKLIEIHGYLQDIDSSDADNIQISKTYHVDTVYLLPTLDTTTTVLDSLKHPIKDSSGHIFHIPTYRNPTMLSKDLVHLQFPIPKRYLIAH